MIVTRKAAKIIKFLNGNVPSLSEVCCGAALARHGHLTHVKYLILKNLDISLVPAGDLSSLVRCVSNIVQIANVNGDLAPVLSSVHCEWLTVSNMALSSDDTQSLVAIMDRRVSKVFLYGDVRLDMRILAQYGGRGSCGHLMLGDGSRRRYGDQVKLWAGDMGWRIMSENDHHIVIERNQ